MHGMRIYRWIAPKQIPIGLFMAKWRRIDNLWQQIKSTLRTPSNAYYYRTSILFSSTHANCVARRWKPMKLKQIAWSDALEVSSNIFSNWLLNCLFTKCRRACTVWVMKFVFALCHWLFNEFSNESSKRLSKCTFVAFNRSFPATDENCKNKCKFQWIPNRRIELSIAVVSVSLRNGSVQFSSEQQVHHAWRQLLKLNIKLKYWTRTATLNPRTWGAGSSLRFATQTKFWGEKPAAEHQKKTFKIKFSINFSVFHKKVNLTLLLPTLFNR